MSRYVTKKHGITIGSGNNFFYRDENEEFRDFPCIVSVSALYFDNHSTLHVGVRSMAEQLLFDPHQTEEEKEYEGHKWTEYRTFYRLREWWVRWLDENCAGWGYPPAKHADRVPSLFFARRKDALAFYERIEDALKGGRFLHEK